MCLRYSYTKLKSLKNCLTKNYLCGHLLCLHKRIYLSIEIDSGIDDLFSQGRDVSIGGYDDCAGKIYEYPD